MTPRWLFVGTGLWVLLLASLWLPVPEEQAASEAAFQVAVAIAGVFLVRYWWLYLKGRL